MPYRSPRRPATGTATAETSSIDDGGQVEILCTKTGIGPLALGGQELSVKAAKPLPSSD